MRTRDRIIELHERGLPNAEIGRAVGVSRQRVWEVLNRKEEKSRYDIPALFFAEKGTDGANDDFECCHFSRCASQHHTAMGQ